MKLSDIKTLQEVARDYNIPFHTLQTRLASKNLNMIEGTSNRGTRGLKRKQEY